jgi:hypothetical protein
MFDSLYLVGESWVVVQGSLRRHDARRRERDGKCRELQVPRNYCLSDSRRITASLLLWNRVTRHSVILVRYVARFEV